MESGRDRETEIKRQRESMMFGGYGGMYNGSFGREGDYDQNTSCEILK